MAGSEELDASLLQAEQEVGIAGEAVELGDQQHGATQTALGERQAELRPVATPAALDLLKAAATRPPHPAAWRATASPGLPPGIRQPVPSSRPARAQ